MFAQVYDDVGLCILRPCAELVLDPRSAGVVVADMADLFALVSDGTLLEVLFVLWPLVFVVLSSAPGRDMLGSFGIQKTIGKVLLFVLLEASGLEVQRHGELFQPSSHCDDLSNAKFCSLRFEGGSTG